MSKRLGYIQILLAISSCALFNQVQHARALWNANNQVNIKIVWELLFLLLFELNVKQQ